MTRTGAGAALLFVAGVVIGTLSDTDDARRVLTHGGERILTADFHVHAAPGDGAMPPGALAREAARHGLDVIAVTNHNQTLAARLATRRGHREGDVIVLPGEEVTTPTLHVSAVGIRETIDWRLPPPALFDAIHTHGGIAIASHPGGVTWPSLDAATLARLDGSEVTHRFGDALTRAEFVDFHRSAKRHNPRLAPIGSSDFHYHPPMGLCRTYVFVREASANGVLDAVREGRTVASDGLGHLYGDAALVDAVKTLVPDAGYVPRPPRSLWRQISLALAWVGLVGLAIVSHG